VGEADRRSTIVNQAVGRGCLGGFPGERADGMVWKPSSLTGAWPWPERKGDRVPPRTDWNRMFQPRWGDAVPPANSQVAGIPWLPASEKSSRKRNSRVFQRKRSVFQRKKSAGQTKRSGRKTKKSASRTFFSPRREKGLPERLISVRGRQRSLSAGLFCPHEEKKVCRRDFFPCAAEKKVRWEEKEVLGKPAFS